MNYNSWSDLHSLTSWSLNFSLSLILSKQRVTVLSLVPLQMSQIKLHLVFLILLQFGSGGHSQDLYTTTTPFVHFYKYTKYHTRFLSKLIKKGIWFSRFNDCQCYASNLLQVYFMLARLDTIGPVGPGWPRLAPVDPGWPRLAPVGPGWPPVESKRKSL